MTIGFKTQIFLPSETLKVNFQTTTYFASICVNPSLDPSLISFIIFFPTIVGDRYQLLLFRSLPVKRRKVKRM